VIVSSVSAYDEPEASGYDEDSALVGLEDPEVVEITGETYGGLKVLCEEAAAEAYGDGLAIIRPTYVIGPHDYTGRFTWWVRRIAAGGDVLAPGPYDAPMQVVVATIPGDGSTNEEFHFTAHLFEGIAKQGANDNCGGPATQLEAGRAWIAMISEGLLPKPRRTVRFLWVPEISGTRAYLKAHPDLAARAVASISTDMVGANQSVNHNSLHLNQTMYSIPSVLNDVSRQFFEYVGETNREKLHNRRIAYAFSNPIVDPTGTHDPFWYHIEKFYGASDHQVHLDWDPRRAVRQLARCRLPLER
jgi:hypothetical protein